MTVRVYAGLLPLCASDEHTSEGTTDDGRGSALCSNPREHGHDGFVWEPTRMKKSRNRGDGLGAELDIWDKLLECIPADGVAHSYGDEERFFERYPAEASLLQERYGHRWREGKKSVNQFSMSAFLAGRLSELSDEGAVAKTWAPAERPWAYDGVISHWARG